MYISKAAPTARHSARGTLSKISTIATISMYLQQSWAPKSIKLGSKIHQVGLQNQEKSVLGGLWRGLGAILAPRAAQDQNIPPKPIKGPPKSIKLGSKMHQELHVHTLVDERIVLEAKSQREVSPSSRGHLLMKWHSNSTSVCERGDEKDISCNCKVC